MRESIGLQSGKSSELDLGFDFTIVRSARRRTISIEVRAAQVSVRAPLNAPKAALLGFLRQKAGWVRAKLAEQRERMEDVPPETQYATGTLLRLMDETLRLVISHGPRAAVARMGNDLHLMLSSRAKMPEQEQIRALLARWYAQQAMHILTRKTHQLCATAGLRCAQVNIRATRSKWGHCTSKGVIQYNWQILLAPEAIVDYLVAHEVSHLRHHNHSPDFWALVTHFCPSCKSDRAWLKANGAGLCL